MIKARLLFRKESTARYISHLDLMHTMQRTFLRSGLHIRHTEGFNPHPYLSIILPLSVGQESQCELMDLDLLDDSELSSAVFRFNAAAPEGITAISVYPRERKGAELKWLRVRGVLTYDNGFDEKTLSCIRECFSRDNIPVTKRTKRGEATIDLAESMNFFDVTSENGKIVIDSVISAQGPSINPDSLVQAIASFSPSCTPDFAEFRRIEVYRNDMSVFR